MKILNRGLSISLGFGQTLGLVIIMTHSWKSLANLAPTSERLRIAVFVTQTKTFEKLPAEQVPDVPKHTSVFKAIAAQEPLQVLSYISGYEKSEFRSKSYSPDIFDLADDAPIHIELSSQKSTIRVGRFIINKKYGPIYYSGSFESIQITSPKATDSRSSFVVSKEKQGESYFEMTKPLEFVAQIIPEHLVRSFPTSKFDLDKQNWRRSAPFATEELVRCTYSTPEILVCDCRAGYVLTGPSR